MRPAEAKLNMTAAELREVFAYDPETGKVTWKVDRYTGRPGRKIIAAGDEAGCVMDSGYRLVVVNYCRIYIHRLAWMLVHGEWPADILDHANMDRADNRLANLRPANESQNRANQKPRAKTGFKGVTKLQNANSYMAQISAHGEHRYLGCFGTAEAAHAAYRAAATQAFGEHARFE